MPKKIIKETLLTLPEVKQLLEERAKEELNYMQRITLDYASKFSKLSVEEARRLVNELISEFGLKMETAVQITNILPDTVHELRVLLTTESKTFTSDELKRMMEVIKKYKK
ncbi:MAG: RNA polymerase Rpb4 family protein [Candidatus Baldrarchaeia archaeon]